MDPPAQILSHYTADGYPKWAFSNYNFDDGSAELVISVAGRRLYVYVDKKDLANWEARDEFAQLTKIANDDFDAEQRILDLVEPGVFDIVEKHSENPLDPATYTVQQHFQPEKFYYQLVDREGGLRAVSYDGDFWLAQGTEPEHELAKLPALAQVNMMDASQLIILPQYEHDDVLTNMAQKVQLRSDGRVFHLKTFVNDKTFVRELEMLTQIAQNESLKHLNFTRLAGLVHYEGAPERVLGCLTEYIEKEDDLGALLGRKKPAGLKQKMAWLGQITKLVHSLHQHGLVWGDAKPDNVVIDKKMDAWVVDFEGGWSPEYVDQDKMETVEGDLQGLLRIEKALLSGEEPKDDKSEGGEDS